VGTRLPYKRITKAFTEVVDETLATPPVLILNKYYNPSGKDRFIRFATDLYLYEFDKTKEKAQTATITDYVTVNNPTYDRDHNDSTYSWVGIPGGTSQDIRLYDFGSVKTRFIYVKVYVDSSSLYNRISISEDGSTWETILNYNTVAEATFLFKKTFRYLKWHAENTGTSTYYPRLYSLEVFDIDDYVARVTSGEHKLITKDGIVWVIIDGNVKVLYYIYDLSDVKVSVLEGEVEI
jgi:hypothetical protein